MSQVFVSLQAVNPQFGQSWRPGRREQIRALNNGASADAERGMGLIIGGVTALFVMLSVEGEFALLVGGLALVLFLLGMIFCLLALRGKKAYLHRCAGQGGGLDVQVLRRGKKFSCDCGITPKVRGEDNHNVVVIALSGWYSRSRAPTRLMGRRFHPSELRFLGVSRYDEKGYCDILFRTPTRYGSALRKLQHVDVSLEEIMATRVGLLSLRLALPDQEFKRVVAMDTRATKGEEVRGLIVDLHDAILGTSRFGKSKEAAEIRRRMLERLEQIYGLQPWIKELKEKPPAKRTPAKR